MIITKIFRFDAAHKLKDYDGNCAHLHGHTYKLYISIFGKVNEKGVVMDFKNLKKIVKELIISKLDHTYINDIIEQPTAENIVIWVWKQLESKLDFYETKYFYETAESLTDCINPTIYEIQNKDKGFNETIEQIVKLCGIGSKGEI